jgi:transglutaminase-like putative cysteine protease
LLVVLLTLTVLPHAAHLGGWIVGFYLVMATYRLAVVWQPERMPGKWLLAGLMVVGVVLVVLDAGGVADGRQGGVSLLVAMLGLKLLEVRTRRDVYMAVFLGYFVVVTQFLFVQSLWVALYLGVLVVGLTSILPGMNRAGPAPPLLPALAQSGKLLAAAVPAMLVLFVLFPRLGGPLWAFSAPGAGAVTGIDDRMSPGAIGRLAESDAVAFRVDFAGDPPAPGARYWRGPVLWDTDGWTWANVEPDQPAAPALAGTDEAVRYEVTLEPTRKRWLFPLDLPLAVSVANERNGALVVTAVERVDKRVVFTAESAPGAWIGELSAVERERALALPVTVTGRMETLVTGWRQEFGEGEGLVNAALRHFREQPFVYTLRPPTLGASPDDAFLFETRRGFCEHYASAFVLLMRIGGVPARVVTGYQGGELNPRGGHLVVRQRDAHAWAEVWLADSGWVRVDPTAAVAPERIERSISAEQDAGAGSPVVFRTADVGAVGRLLREARWMIDSMELGWHRWVIGFSRDRQERLLEGLGLQGLRGYAQGLAAVVVGGMALAAGILLLRLRGGRRQDPVKRSYERLRRKLERAGLPTSAAAGPRDIERAAIAGFPAQEAQLRELFGLYVRLRYGRSAAARDQHRFRAGVSRLRLGGREVRSGRVPRARPYPP